MQTGAEVTKRETKVHSKWECPKCDFTYEAPIVGQEVLVHRFVDGGRRVFHAVRRVWESKYNRIGRLS